MTATGSLAVWLADLDQLGPTLDDIDARTPVSSDEESGWRMLANAGIGQRRCRARLVARLLLHRAGHQAALAHAFIPDAHGKPTLRDGFAAFSISHAGHHALIAIGPAGAGIGVDLENERKVDMAPHRARHLIAAAEAMTSSQPLPLIAAWTRLESLAKARGTGIGRLLTDLGLTNAAAHAATCEITAQRTRDFVAATGLAVLPLSLPGGHYGAIAANRDLLAEPPAVTILDEAACRALALPPG